MAVLLERANTEYLSTTTVPYSTLGSNGLTLSMWFRPVDQVDQYGILLHSSGTNLHHLFLNNGKVAAASDAGSTSVSSESAAAGATDTWHHAAAVFDGESSRVGYLNGTGAAAETSTRAPTGLDKLHIGARGGVQPFDGYLAHVAIWTRALSADEIAELHGGESPRSLPSSLWAYLPLLSDTRDEVGTASWTENGTLSFDASVDPLLRRTRLGLYGGPRPLWGLLSPKAEVIVAKGQQDRLGLYGGPRQLWGAFSPKTEAAGDAAGGTYRPTHRVRRR